MFQLLPQGIRIKLNPTISKQLSSKITEFFSKEKIDELAKETRFIERNRNITGSGFLELLLFSRFNNSKLSLENLAENYYDNTGQVISKQAIDLRFTDEAVMFLKKIIEKALNEINLQKLCFVFLKQFNQVRIKDSTSFQLPENLAYKYKGSGGAASKAMIRIQFEYDLKTGKILELELHPFIKQDLSNSTETLHKINASDLVIRDLGYTSVEVIKGIKSQKAYLIARLMSGVNVFEKKNDEFVKIKFKDIYAYMQKNKLQSIEKEVYITDKKELVRVIIELLPEVEVKKRLRKAEKDAKKKGRQLSAEYKSRARLNIFITNIPKKHLDKTQIHELYTVRWQIELVFKIWKSIGEIEKVKKMKVERFECYLYAKLLWIIINWSIVWSINKLIHKSSDKLLSFYKCYKSLKDKIQTFQTSINTGTKSLAEFIENQIFLSSRHHLLDKKKNKISLYELIQMK